MVVEIVFWDATSNPYLVQCGIVHPDNVFIIVICEAQKESKILSRTLQIGLALHSGNSDSPDCIGESWIAPNFKLLPANRIAKQ